MAKEEKTIKDKENLQFERPSINYEHINLYLTKKKKYPDKTIPYHTQYRIGTYVVYVCIYGLMSNIYLSLSIYRFEKRDVIKLKKHKHNARQENVESNEKIRKRSKKKI